MYCVYIPQYIMCMGLFRLCPMRRVASMLTRWTTLPETARGWESITTLTGIKCLSLGYNKTLHRKIHNNAYRRFMKSSRVIKVASDNGRTHICPREKASSYSVQQYYLSNLMHMSREPGTFMSCSKFETSSFDMHTSTRPREQLNTCEWILLVHSIHIYIIT